MRLVRYGEAGHEKPGLLDATGQIRDLSGHIPDITGDILNPAGLNHLRQIKPELMSRATTLSSMLQQLSFSVGVGVGAILLNLSLRHHQTTQLGADDFWPALVIIGLMTLGSVPFFTQLALNAGAGLRKKHEAIKPPLEEHTA